LHFHFPFEVSHIFGSLGCSIRADDVELDEEEREPIDGEELEEGRDVDNEDEDEEEGIYFDWVDISELCLV